ncbi:MAG: hypothetical protein J5879_02055 [Clostridia bacterium]|nr:hypothetical protein [Clostridia bacterium]
MKDKYRIKMIALCGVFSAAELVIIYLSSLTDMLDLAISSMTILFTIVLMAEYGKKPTFVVYAVVSLLCMLISARKFSPLCYIFFMGLYPVIKSFFDKPPKVLGYVLKLIYFNAAYMLLYVLVVHFAMLDDIFAIGSLMFYVTIVSANIAFLLCDYVITVMSQLYTRVLRKKFGFDRIFKK